MTTIFTPLRDAMRQTGRAAVRFGRRLDTLSLELARDVGAVGRDAQALATAVHDQGSTLARATPRAAKLAQVAASLVAHQRYLALRAAARGQAGLSDDDTRALAQRATAAFAELRGGVVKLAQLASCRPDLVGAIWAAELATLQSDVPAIDAAAIRARIEAELGGELATWFADFDDVPLAAASLAQVHAARLHDGTAVVVKVQVPGIDATLAADLAALRTVARTVGELPGVDLATLSAELGRALLLELDYVAEAEALRAFATQIGPDVVVPRPIAHASSARVLTMTRIDGEPLQRWLVRATEAGDLVARDRLLAALVGEFAAQIWARGLVHADPHPGNLMVTPGGRLGLIDFGCVLTLDAAERAGYARLVMALLADDRDAAATALAGLGFTADDPAQLLELARTLTAPLRSATDAAAPHDWDAAFRAQLGDAATLPGLHVPRSFVLLGRVLATISGPLATYRPALDVARLVGPHLAAALR